MVSSAEKGKPSKCKRWPQELSLWRCTTVGCGVKVLERDKVGHAGRCTGGKVSLRKHFEAAGSIPLNPEPDIRPPVARKSKAWF